MKAVAPALLISALATASPVVDGGTPLPTAAGRVSTDVMPLKQLREAGLVRQGWDVSCGSAALSTILTYHFGDPFSEATIAVSILANTDPERVRARGGFSLLDLKRFAEAVGYQAEGYAQLTLEDLEHSPVPAILPIRYRDLDHFVVFRGRAGNRVLIGDPAFGNLTLSLAQFDEAWSSRIGFFVREVGQSPWDPGQGPLAPNALNTPLPNLDYVHRLLRAGGPVPPAIRHLPVTP
ncbi:MULTISPECIES: C39 family peptidase [Ectothiorhodospira]|uniref:C39 family peptidase n=1 Tax=Ectothiorhodospira TaxID=1051 RepID=UPI001EE7F7EB|nr:MULTISPECIES: C39 family peptidase [Ectothiorhodospira]MCG5492943.1 C39 family peptidase [Ectothiorhodospira variabilis]MCG5497336.1 C39 family peptidase [Ectothiorhodospira variabilis]MCG5502272.1 C39 family peptidase [Ectothiorhodospira variabilis]MCG5505962.1 C39 family peptidase [Ectothiorhodospira variabilis]MCG5526276.1 C39 family peptidase [Ectothiorhodospira haloalkaliphila]